MQIYSSHEAAEMRGEFYSPTVEHGPFPKYYTISARVEDTYFADCVLNDKPPEFTPEQAKEAVAVVLLSYLSAKKRTLTPMAELKTIARTEGTHSILEGLGEVMQHNHEHLKW
ncbi:MAG: hypothetical protein HWN69_10405 [Desulfobacterales bacterium]|nr:hypothetical protein [Desulfobacterales bacterium]